MNETQPHNDAAQDDDGQDRDDVCTAQQHHAPASRRCWTPTQADVVCSVPHSGTRTLVDYLGVGGNSPRGRWLHFGYKHDIPVLKAYRHHLHIPLRHPLEVAASHARRGKNVDALVSAYQCMFAWLRDAPAGSATMYRMEDLPTLAGGDDWDRDGHGDGRVEQYRGIVRSKVLQSHGNWFARYYDDIHLEVQPLR